jgi:hypothetical protein
LTRPEEEFGKGEEKQWKVTRKCMYHLILKTPLLHCATKLEMNYSDRAIGEKK